MANIGGMNQTSMHRAEDVGGPINNTMRSEMSGSVRAHLRVSSTGSSRPTSYFYGQPESTAGTGFKSSDAVKVSSVGVKGL
jgi:hypothetical protein